MVPMIKLDLDGLPPEERFESWRSNLSLLFDASLDPGAENSAATTHLTTYHFGSLLFTNAASQRQMFQRTSRLISQTGVDHFLLQVYRQGRTEGRCGKNHLGVRPGDVFLLDLAQTLDTRVDDFDNFTLVVPRQLLAQHLKSPEKLNGQVLPRESVPGRLLHEHLSLLWNACAEVTLEEAGILGQGVVGMIAAYFSQLPLSEDSPEIDTTISLAIRQYIDAHFLDPNLGPEALRGHFRISRAQLYRLFKPYGGVSEYIKERRLLWSLSELSKTGDKPQRIIDIAMAAGFSSEAHFSRIFKQAFGLSPREARQRGALEVIRSTWMRSNDERRLQEWFQRLGR